MPAKKRGRPPKKTVADIQSSQVENTEPSSKILDLDTKTIKSEKRKNAELDLEKKLIKDDESTQKGLEKDINATTKQIEIEIQDIEPNTRTATIEPKNEAILNKAENASKRRQSVSNNGTTSVVKKPRIPKGEKRNIECLEKQQPNIMDLDNSSSKIMKLPEKPKLKQDSDIQPSSTIYLSNLNDKIKKQKLQKALFLLFVAYGDIIEIQINWKNRKMRGQAFILFSHENEAKLALRSLQNYEFFGKPLLINFSKRQLTIK